MPTQHIGIRKIVDRDINFLSVGKSPILMSRSETELENDVESDIIRMYKRK